MEELFHIPETKGNPNPCILLYGLGPEGAKCKSCVLLLHRVGANGRRWYKCALRRASFDRRYMGASSTDHRLKWDACGRYEREGEVAQ